MNINELKTRYNSGEKLKFLFFWGHKPEADGRITNSCFSQWFEIPFIKDGIRYSTSEHYMMAKKAELFNDVDSQAKILKARTPSEAKSIGRCVSGFSERKWDEVKENIVYDANFCKFEQNSSLQDHLLMTGQKILVEASPQDRIWGIGLSATDKRAGDPNTWDGANLLGFMLMNVREALRNNISF